MGWRAINSLVIGVSGPGRVCFGQVKQTCKSEILQLFSLLSIDLIE